MSEKKKVTRYTEQNKIKPMIEDVIPDFLDGDNKRIALEFIAYLRENKMKPVWAIQNGWKAVYKGKVLYYIRLPKHEQQFRTKKQSDETEWTRSWVVTPFPQNINKYEELIINEGWQNLIWENMGYCYTCPNAVNSYKCEGINKTILGKEFENLCRGQLYGGGMAWFVNPDETTISYIKKLLDFEKQARV